MTTQFVVPSAIVDAQTCGVEWYDRTVDPWQFIRNDTYPDTDWHCIPCAPGTSRAGDINTNELWCAGGSLPDPPPNYPGIYAGSACQAGSSRTVSITPTGDTHDIQISPSNQIVALGGNSYTFTNLQQGVSYQFRARAENSGGSSGWSSWTGSVQQDLSAPTTTLDLVGTAGLNSWWQSAVSATLPATDSGCLGVSSTLYTLDGVANSYTGSAVNISGEGTHNLSYYSTDGSYTETAQNATILIDTVAPSLTLTPDRVADGSAGWWIGPVTVSLSASDSASGINSLESNLNSAGWTNYINPITFSVDGTYNLDGRAIDVSGWETVDGLVIPLDSTAPTLGFTFSRPTDYNGWYTSAVDVGVTSSDATSGLAGTIARLRSEGTWQPYTSLYTLNGDGQHIFEAIATDIASNTTAQEVTVPIDITAPNLDLTFDRPPDTANGWWTAPVTVTLSASDATSSLATLESNLNSAGWTAYIAPIILNEAVHNFDARAIDVAGWQTQSSVSIPVDTTAPTLTLTTDRPPDTANGWWIAPVTVTLSASDVTSSLATLESNLNSAGWSAYIAPITLGDNAHSFTARAIDVAGLETVSGLSIPIDSTDPYLEFIFSREPDRNGWYNSSVHVAIQAGDNTSDIAEVQARLAYEGTWRDYEGAYLIGGDGEHIFEAEVTDYAGHSINRQTLVPIDIVAPVTTLIWDGHTLDFTVTDNRSGVMGTTLTINGVVTEYTGIPIAFEFAGDYRIEVYSTDMAGNDEAVQVLNISYDPDAETTLVPLTSPTLSADMTCSDERYDIAGFASSSTGLSSVYLLEGDSIVAGGRTDYSPASSEVEAFAFSYAVSGESLDLSIVALADDGSERRLSLTCPADSSVLVPMGFSVDDFYNQLLIINPPDDIPETSVAETENNADSVSLNQYPTSLGDRSTVLEEVTPNEIQDPAPVPASAQQSVSNTNSGANTAQIVPVPMPVIDTTVTVLESSSPELTYVTGKTNTLSVEELAKILAATGLLVTATAGVGLQVTETARRRKEELEEEYIAEQARLEKERIAQAERARENAEMNAQMRFEAQQAVFIEVEQSEANKRYHEHVAELWAEYYAHLDAWNQQQQALAVAQTQVYTLEPGSTIADLPKEIQDIFWELGNMHYETNDDYMTAVGWTDDNGETWNFQDGERRNLGYYQYLIRTAVAEGDMDAVIEHATKASGYVGTALVNRIEREMEYTAKAGLERVQTQQNRYQPNDPRTLLEITESGLEQSHGWLERRAGQLNTELVLREKTGLSDFVALQVDNHRGNNAASILSNHQAIQEQRQQLTNDLLSSSDIVQPSGFTHNPKTGDAVLGGLVPIMQDDTALDEQTPSLKNQIDATSLTDAERGTFVELLNIAGMDTEVARLAQLEILDMLDTTLSSDIDGTFLGVEGEGHGWRDEQIDEAFAGISLTLDALADLARNGGVPLDELSGTVSNIYTKWVGPTEIRLVDDTGVNRVRERYSETQWHWNENDPDRVIGQRKNHAVGGSNEDVYFDTIWREDTDDNLILLPSDFGHILPTDEDGNPVYGEEFGRWLLAGELGMAINNRAFGLMAHNLSNTGIETERRTTSGEDNTAIFGRPWVYDEQGVFDFSDLGGPNGSPRGSLSNETPEDEIRDMFKQWVFLNDFLGDNDFETADELIVALAGSQGYLTHEPNPNMTDVSGILDEQRILGVANMLGIELTDEERSFYTQWSRGNDVLGLDDPYQTNRTLEIQATLRQELGIADHIPMNFDMLVENYIHRYNEERPLIDTFFQRNAYMDVWLSQAYATSQIWRDREFQLRMLNDFATTHDNILDAPEHSNRFYYNTPVNVNDPIQQDALYNAQGRYIYDSRNVFGAESIENLDLRAFRDMNPSTYFNMYESQRDTTFRLLSLTDWANPILQIERDSDGGFVERDEFRRGNSTFTDHYEVSAYYPPGLQAMSNAQLSELWRSDIPPEAQLTLQTAMREYDARYTLADGSRNYPDSYDMFGFATGDDDPTVINRNAQTLFVGGLIAASVIAEPIDWLVGGADSVAMLLNGNVIGATANSVLTVAPGAWGQLRHAGRVGSEIVQGGARAVAPYIDTLVQGGTRALRQTAIDMANDVRWFIRKVAGSDGQPVYALVGTNGRIYAYADDLYVLMNDLIDPENGLPYQKGLDELPNSDFPPRPPSRTGEPRVGSQTGNTTRNGEILNENLAGRGIVPDSNIVTPNAHHIIPGTLEEAYDLRNRLDGWDIDINSADNGVFLESAKGGIHGQIHSGRSGNRAYVAWLTEQFENVTTREEALEVLADIAERLAAGMYP